MDFLRRLKKTTERCGTSPRTSARDRKDENASISATQSPGAPDDDSIIGSMFGELKIYNVNQTYRILGDLGRHKRADVAQRILSLDHYYLQGLNSRDWNALESALVSIGELAVEPIIGALGSGIYENPFRQDFLLRCLRRIDSPTALPRIIQYVQQSMERSIAEGKMSIFNMDCALEFLSDQKDMQATETLVNLLTYLVGMFHLEDTAWSHQRAGVNNKTLDCIKALVKQNAQSAIPALVSILNHPQAEWHIKVGAKQALAILSSRQSPT